MSSAKGFHVVCVIVLVPFYCSVFVCLFFVRVCVSFINLLSLTTIAWWWRSWWRRPPCQRSATIALTPRPCHRYRMRSQHQQRYHHPHHRLLLLHHHRRSRQTPPARCADEAEDGVRAAAATSVQMLKVLVESRARCHCHNSHSQHHHHHRRRHHEQQHIAIMQCLLVSL